MTTELKRFTDSYASMTVAVYEPLIVRWFSQQVLWTIADSMAKRAVSSGSLSKNALTAAPRMLSRSALPEDLEAVLEDEGVDVKELLARDGRDFLAKLPEAKREAVIARLPMLGRAGDVLLPGGELELTTAVAGADKELLSGIPVLTSNAPAGVRDDLDVKELRQTLIKDFDGIVKEMLEVGKLLPASELRKKIVDAAKGRFAASKHDVAIDLLPVLGEWEEYLSPIGIAHFYRQLYFNSSEGAGPIEEAFTIAPAETLEVVYETVRRQIHEELVEMGSEVVSESAVEAKNLDEVSDKVSSMIQRDSSAAMSANATISGSGDVGVWSVSASATLGASADLKTSTQRGTELASRRLKETTKRASERITKTFSIKTRDVLDITTTNVTRRIIKNATNAPLSYGLRRVYRRVEVKVQNLGPRLVWQLYVREPGRGLALSKFVHFQEASPVATPSQPPATKPRPAGGTDTGTTVAALQWDNGRKTYFVTVVVTTGSDRRVTAVSIDSITDLEGGGKEDYAPSARNDVQWAQSYDAATGTFKVNIGILPGDAASVQIGFTYVYDAGPSVLTAWEQEQQKAQAEFAQAEAKAREEALRAQFERDRALITERSKIRSRPANDLRKEERYEVMNRMVSHLFGPSKTGAEPSPLDIELFHRYFDIEMMFVYNHPSWWKPRYSPITTGLRRKAYEITAESEPAPLGSSLGWLLQLDGDARRNEFLNSPWLRVCMPMRPGREAEAIGWLAEHIEGQLGYDPKKEPLKSLLADIAAIRKREVELGIDGPDYVTVDSTVGAPDTALKPENVYPVVDEFEVTVPTDGFIYDEIQVKIP